jgi:hypothetical protein
MKLRVAPGPSPVSRDIDTLDAAIARPGEAAYLDEAPRARSGFSGAG